MFSQNTPSTQTRVNHINGGTYEFAIEEEECSCFAECIKIWTQRGQCGILIGKYSHIPYILYVQIPAQTQFASIQTNTIIVGRARWRSRILEDHHKHVRRDLWPLDAVRHMCRETFSIVPMQIICTCALARRDDGENFSTGPNGANSPLTPGYLNIVFGCCTFSLFSPSLSLSPNNRKEEGGATSTTTGVIVFVVAQVLKSCCHFGFAISLRCCADAPDMRRPNLVCNMDARARPFKFDGGQAKAGIFGINLIRDPVMLAAPNTGLCYAICVPICVDTREKWRMANGKKVIGIRAGQNLRDQGGIENALCGVDGQGVQGESI